MANDFLNVTKQMLALHGQSGTYTRVSAGVYDIAAGGTTNTSTDTTIQVYKQHIKANQFNSPHLIGRDAAMFLIAGDALGFIPKVKDLIVFQNETYVVDSFREHFANGEVCMYKLTAIRG